MEINTPQLSPVDQCDQNCVSTWKQIASAMPHCSSVYQRTIMMKLNATSEFSSRLTAAMMHKPPESPPHLPLFVEKCVAGTGTPSREVVERPPVDESATESEFLF